jgi:hypothetical protein
MRIDYLARRLHFLPTLAEWMYRGWFPNLGLTLEHAVNQLHERLHEDELRWRWSPSRTRPSAWSVSLSMSLPTVAN